MHWLRKQFLILCFSPLLISDSNRNRIPTFTAEPVPPVGSEPCPPHRCWHQSGNNGQPLPLREGSLRSPSLCSGATIPVFLFINSAIPILDSLPTLYINLPGGRCLIIIGTEAHLCYGTCPRRDATSSTSSITRFIFRSVARSGSCVVISTPAFRSRVTG